MVTILQMTYSNSLVFAWKFCLILIKLKFVPNPIEKDMGSTLI